MTGYPPENIRRGQYFTIMATVKPELEVYESDHVVVPINMHEASSVHKLTGAIFQVTAVDLPFLGTTVPVVHADPEAWPIVLVDTRKVRLKRLNKRFVNQFLKGGVNDRPGGSGPDGKDDDGQPPDHFGGFFGSSPFLVPSS